MKRPPGYDKLKRVRELRREMTDAEKKLWSRLRAGQLGVKFRKQVWLGHHIADFLCVEAKLVVEVDGGQHDVRQKKDAVRARQMAELGFRTIRFWNHDVLENVDGVLSVIGEALPSPSHPPGGGRAPPSPQVGEGC
jgi:very-short-patch-repair endonuclease